ncbi:MAG: SCO family protein [Alphaproteobacteria bacterium]
MSLRTIRRIAWAGVAIVVATGLISLLFLPEKHDSIVESATIGGPFSLTDQHGNTVTEADLSGHPSALFFGYTHCPDVCPTTLFEATGWLQVLGDAADRLNFYFVTVDPERDTIELLADYMEAFDPRITALTGSRGAVDQILRGYRIYAAKAGDDADFYTMDHTASVFLLDDAVRLFATIDYQESSDIALAKLRRLIAAN